MPVSNEIRAVLKKFKGRRPPAEKGSRLSDQLMAVAAASIIVECLVGLSSNDKRQALNGLEVLVKDMWAHIERLCDERHREDAGQEEP
jgi:hypothetical protein